MEPLIISSEGKPIELFLNRITISLRQQDISTSTFSRDSIRSKKGSLS